MQLTLAFLNLPDQSPKGSTSDHRSTAWDDIDETSRLAALAILARLIAQMLTAEREKGAGND
jgi:hypothetical protein